MTHIPKPSNTSQAHSGTLSRGRAWLVSWATSSRPFPLRRAVIAVITIWTLLLLAAVTTLAAAAAPKGGGLGAFAIFDMTDSRGIRISQYELSIDTGLIINPLKMWLAQRLLTGWDIYRYSVGLMAYIVDWTISMSWLSVITAPLQDAAMQIRNHVITPSGVAGLMLLLSAAVGGLRMVFGKLGAGLWDIVSALAVATAVSLLLVSPVSAVTGEPLTKVRNVGIAVAGMINDGGVLATTNIDANNPQTKLDAGPVLIDALVRPGHGLVNYGVNFTDDQKCTPAYDKALKAGPYWDPEAAEQSDAVSSCDKALGKFADNAIYTASLGMSIFLVTGFLVGGLVLVASALMFIAVMMLAWNLLKLVVTGVIGIGPGDTRGPLIRNACQAAASLIYVGISIIVLAVILVLIKKSFTADTAPMVRFLLTDIVIIAGLVVVVQTWLAHRRGAESWAEKLMTRMKQTAPKPTIGSKVGSWLKAPAGGEAGKYGDFAGAGAAGWGGSSSRGMGVGRMLRPITHSNAFQLAKFAGATAATGGAGALTAGAFLGRGTAMGVAGMARGTAMGVAGIARGTAMGVADSARGTVASAALIGRGAVKGARLVADGVGTVGDSTQRARSWLHDRTAAAASTTAAAAVLHLGRNDRTGTVPDMGAPGQHRSEDPSRSKQRIQGEEQLRRVQKHTGTTYRPTPPAGPTGTPGITAAAPSRPAAGQRRAATTRGQDGGMPVTVEAASTAADRITKMVHPQPSGRSPRAGGMRR